ncbi:MAG: hypothetical protein R2838_00075 [Caldilineaceae bacterium]
MQAWGERAGADAATRHLNAIYGELTTVINRWGGSVVGFSGDGLLCWFDAPLRGSERKRSAGRRRHRAGIHAALLAQVAVSGSRRHLWL